MATLNRSNNVRTSRRIWHSEGGGGSCFGGKGTLRTLGLLITMLACHGGWGENYKLLRRATRSNGIILKFILAPNSAKWTKFSWLSIRNAICSVFHLPFFFQFGRFSMHNYQMMKWMVFKIHGWKIFYSNAQEPSKQREKKRFVSK